MPSPDTVGFFLSSNLKVSSVLLNVLVRPLLNGDTVKDNSVQLLTNSFMAEN